MPSEAKGPNRERKISLAAAYTPLGPDAHYDRKEYGKEVENASKNGFDYFITAFNMDTEPWEVNESSLAKTGES